MVTRKLGVTLVSVGIVLQFVILCTAAPQNGGLVPNKDASKGGHYQDHTAPPPQGGLPLPNNGPSKGGHYQYHTDGPQHPTHPPQHVSTNNPTKGGGHPHSTDNPQYPTDPVTDHDDSTTDHDGHTGAKIIATTIEPTPGGRSYYLWWVVGLAIAALLIIVIAITVTCLKKRNNFNPNEHTPLQDDTTQEQQTQYN